MGTEKQCDNKWGRQWVGIFGGAAVGWTLTVVFPAVEERFGLFSVVIWSAVIGGVLTSLGGFMRGGAALTLVIITISIWQLVLAFLF